MIFSIFSPSGDKKAFEAGARLLMPFLVVRERYTLCYQIAYLAMETSRHCVDCSTEAIHQTRIA